MNRKATFAKRQRESDLKDHARQKQERKTARQASPRATKGPEIAWDEALPPATTDETQDNQPSLVPTDDSP